MSYSAVSDNKTQLGLEFYIVNLIAEGVRRGYTFEILHAPSSLLRVACGGRGFIFQCSPGYLARARRDDRWNLLDKEYQKGVMRRFGLPVPETYQIVKHPVQIDAAALRFPVVCKPRSGSSGGTDVVTNIATMGQLVGPVLATTNRGRDCLIEAHVHGDHYRLLVLWSKYAGCVRREPLTITGDGVHTIAQLIDVRNQEPHRSADRGSTRARIEYTEEMAHALHARGLMLKSIPAAGTEVLLQNTMVGGTGNLVDVTDDVHPETIARCERLAAELDLPVVGFDLITPDIRSSCATVGAFNEMNPWNVLTTLNEHCTHGPGQPVSRMIWDGVPFDQVATTAFPEF
jgi:D-alanine-D-alanine ligase-like ATP-grasp enzyme